MKEYTVKKSECFPDGKAIIYTLQEANELGIEYHRLPDGWRKAQVGEYAETIDGYVTPIIKRNDNGKADYVKTPTGCFNQNRKGTIFDTAEFYDRNRYSRTTRWNGNSTKLNPQQTVFFAVLRTTFNIDLAFETAYPNIVKGSGKKAEFVTSKLFKEYMMDFKKLLELNGVTPEYLAAKVKDWIEEGNSRDRTKLLAMAGNILGIRGLSPELPSAKRPALFSGVEEAEFEMNQPKQLTEPTSVN